MSISISLSEYNQSKEANIEGIDFVVRPMSSSESLALLKAGELL